MGNLSERLRTLSTRSTETREVEGVGTVALRAPSWGESNSVQPAPEGVDHMIYATFLGAARTIRDPETGEPIYPPTPEGFASFSDLPVVIARRLTQIASEFLSRQAGFTVAAPESKQKKSSRRAPRSRT